MLGKNFSNYNIDNSSINLVDGESLILPSSCTQSNVNNVNNLNLVAKEELLKDKSKCLISTFDKNFGVSSIIDIANYSSYMKLLRVTRWVIKFIEKLKLLKNPNHTYKPYITSSNINEAKVLWIRDVQKDILTSFNYQDLQHQLGLYYDDTKLLRCRGRLGNADMPYESKHPVILPKNHRFTDLVIAFYHCIVKHNGTRDTLNMLRSEHWIPQGRSYVNKILRQCIVCKKHEGKAYYYPQVLYQKNV